MCGDFWDTVAMRNRAVPFRAETRRYTHSTRPPPGRQQQDTTHGRTELYAHDWNVPFQPRTPTSPTRTSSPAAAFRNDQDAHDDGWAVYVSPVWAIGQKKIQMLPVFSFFFAFFSFLFSPHSRYTYNRFRTMAFVDFFFFFQSSRQLF